MDFIIRCKKAIQAHVAYPYLREILRALLTYLSLFLMTRVVIHAFRQFYFQYTEEILGSTVGKIMDLPFVLLLINSVLLAFAIYQREEREVCLQNKDNITFSFWENLPQRLSNRFFWSKIIVFFLCFLQWPITVGFWRILELFPASLGLSPTLQRLCLLPLFLIAVIAIDCYTGIEAKRFWLETPSRLSKMQLWKSRKKKKAQVYSPFRLLLRLMGYTLIYLVGAFMLAIVIPVTFSICAIIVMLLANKYIFFTLLAVILLAFFLTFRKRWLFIRALKKLCRKNGFCLYGLHRPYLSILRECKGHNFDLEANGRLYRCRMLASVKRSNKVYIDEDGSYTRVFAFHVPLPQFVKSRGYVQTFQRGNGDNRELFQIRSVVDYRFETDRNETKILILNPVARRVMRTVAGHAVELDNGERVGEYIIFTGNAFLRALERDCID